LEQVKEQLKREPKPFPRLVLSKEVKDLESFRPEMVTLEGYNPHPVLRAKMTVAGGFDEKDRKAFKANGKDKVKSPKKKTITKKTKTKPKR